MTWLQCERAVKLALGVAVVWHQTAIADQPNPYVFAGGLTLLGVTEAVRWDLARRGRNDDDRPASPTGGQPPSAPSEPVAS